MKKPEALQAYQLESFARFLAEHPDFAPQLTGQDALVCGFRVGNSFLGIAEMEQLIATQPHFDALDAAQLLTPSGPPARLQAKHPF